MERSFAFELDGSSITLYTTRSDAAAKLRLHKMAQHKEQRFLTNSIIKEYKYRILNGIKIITIIRTILLPTLFLLWCFSYIVCFVNCLVFNTRVNVYFQGNRKCSFLPGCACLYLYWLTLFMCFKLNDDTNLCRLNKATFWFSYSSLVSFVASLWPTNESKTEPRRFTV